MMSLDNLNTLEQVVPADQLGIDGDQLGQGLINNGWGVYDCTENFGSVREELVGVYSDEVEATDEVARLTGQKGYEEREIDDDPESWVINSRYFIAARLSLTDVDVSVRFVARYEQIDE